MNIIKFDKTAHLEKCLEIFNEFAYGEGIFKPLDEKTFSKKFCSASYNSIGVVCMDEKEITGFAFGTVGDTALFISYIGVEKKNRKKGIGTKLLTFLEKEMLLQNPYADRIDCMFYNPCQLSWKIPNNPLHSHPGTPGVDMESEGYAFLKSMGYEDYAVQNAYHMSLSKLSCKSKTEINKQENNTHLCFDERKGEENKSENTIPLCPDENNGDENIHEQLLEKIENRKKHLHELGIEIGFYNENLHFGFNELFDNIKNEGWRKSVMGRLNEPVVVATFNYSKCCDEYREKIKNEFFAVNKETEKDENYTDFFNGKNSKSLVIGYSGPLSVAEDGRGLFCGIGVHTAFRSGGIGRVLFYNLCLGLKNMGASYMSLFTGNNNPARFVYEGTGFEIARTFSCMRKKLK